jgi:hypothetical protein
VQVAFHIPFNEGYNFVLDLISIGGLHTKLEASKVVGVSILGISGFSLGSLKMTFGARPMPMHKVYYKGEGGGFSQVWVVVSLVNLCLLVVNPCTKVVPATH